MNIAFEMLLTPEYNSIQESWRKAYSLKDMEMSWKALFDYRKKA